MHQKVLILKALNPGDARHTHLAHPFTDSACDFEGLKKKTVLNIANKNSYTYINY